MTFSGGGRVALLKNGTLRTFGGFLQNDPKISIVGPEGSATVSICGTFRKWHYSYQTFPRLWQRCDRAVTLTWSDVTVTVTWRDVRDERDVTVMSTVTYVQNVVTVECRDCQGVCQAWRDFCHVGVKVSDGAHNSTRECCHGGVTSLHRRWYEPSAFCHGGFERIVTKPSRTVVRLTWPRYFKCSEGMLWNNSAMTGFTKSSRSRILSSLLGIVRHWTQFRSLDAISKILEIASNNADCGTGHPTGPCSSWSRVGGAQRPYTRRPRSSWSRIKQRGGGGGA